MKKKCFYISAAIFVMATTCFGQQTDTVIRLEEVGISDTKIKNFSKGYKINTLKDSVIQRAQVSLTSLLRFNSSIFFRENGFGGVSSASFRGTSASQTAVVWNGININSQLNGQTDFNTIAVNNYDHVDIRSGGGSVQYGSGAIGGSIHLNNDFEFVNQFRNNLNASYGSFDTARTNYKVRYGSSSTYVDFGIDLVDSENDYKYLGSEFRNQNGAFRNMNINANFGFRLSKNHVLKFHQNTFMGNRNFSGLFFGNSVSVSNNRYRDSNTRSLIRWIYSDRHIDSKLSLAYLYEKYQFFETQREDDFDFGKSNTRVFKYDLQYHLNSNKLINAIADYTLIKGEGTALGSEKKRGVFSGVLLYKHSLSKALDYGVNVRQEITDNYESPLLFALDVKYTPSQFYTLKLNGSRNYRIPTYNDLYWVGPGGLGNPDLKPETSLQGEINQEFKYKNAVLSFIGYYIRAKDLIKWIPVSATEWSPINIGGVDSYGAEVDVKYQKRWGKHEVNFITNYGYTISEDKETSKQLIYVPFHKVTSSFSYSFQSLVAFYQFLYNDAVFVTTDNSRTIDGYDISNMGLGFTYWKSKDHEYRINFSVNNLYNRNYQNVGFRPMPNRNYQLQLTFKF